MEERGGKWHERGRQHAAHHDGPPEPPPEDTARPGLLAYAEQARSKHLHAQENADAQSQRDTPIGNQADST